MKGEIIIEGKRMKVDAFGRDLQDPVVINRSVLRKLIANNPKTYDQDEVAQLSKDLRSIANKPDCMWNAIKRINEWFEWHDTISQFRDNEILCHTEVQPSEANLG